MPRMPRLGMAVSLLPCPQQMPGKRKKATPSLPALVGRRQRKTQPSTPSEPGSQTVIPTPGRNTTPFRISHFFIVSTSPTVMGLFHDWREIQFDMIRNCLELTRTSNIDVCKFLNFGKIMLIMSSGRIRELLDVGKEDEGISVMRKKGNFCIFLSGGVDLAEKPEEKGQTEAIAFMSELDWLNMFDDATSAVRSAEIEFRSISQLDSLGILVSVWSIISSSLSLSLSKLIESTTS